MNKKDAVIIGFGKGGKTLAAALAAKGKSVAVIEQSEKMYGGTCINVACIPTKSLVHSAALSASIGGSFAERSARYAAAISEKERLTSMLRSKNYHKLADNENISVIDGTGSFSDAHHIHVALPDGNEDDYEAELIFINTGARPFLPPIEGLSESKFVYVSETMLDLKKLPAKLVIIGGGYIGIEFASMYANFGADVTIIQDGEVFLPREDPEIAAAVLTSIEARGIRFLRSTAVGSVSDHGDHAVVSADTASEHIELDADAVLVAAGRRPNISFAPEKAGIKLTPRNAVLTDEHLQSSVPGIYAMGDVVGGLQFTYISLDDYRIVLSAVCGNGEYTAKTRGAVPYSVFIDPPFSRVGLSEKEAREKGYDVKIARLPAAAIPKAQVLQKPTGLLKAIIDNKTGLILGAHLFCEESYEMINTVKLAMDANVPYTVLRDNIYTHPTMTEGFNDLFSV